MVLASSSPKQQNHVSQRDVFLEGDGFKERAEIRDGGWDSEGYCGEMMRILITGHEGVIGTELWKMLEGHELFGIDKKDGNDLVKVDLDNRINLIEPEIVFHLAASFERTRETPEAFKHVFCNDTLASHRLLEVVQDCMSVKTVVFASSYLIYRQNMGTIATNSGLLIGEETAISPRNLCGASKLYTERELEFICKSIRPDIRHVNARIFRVYGLDGKEIVSRWCRAKVRSENAVVFNQENRFDFIHARDVAQGLKRLAFTKEAQGIVNLGTGRSRSVKEVYELIGLKPDKIDDDEDWEASCADVSKLKDLTGWSPSIELETGIEELLEFERSDYERVKESGVS